MRQGQWQAERTAAAAAATGPAAAAAAASASSAAAASASKSAKVQLDAQAQMYLPPLTSELLNQFVVSNKVQTAQTKRRNRRLSQINDQKRASLFGSCDSSPSGRDSPSPSVGDDSARVSGAAGPAAAAAPPPKFRPPPSRAEAALRAERLGIAPATAEVLSLIHI